MTSATAGALSETLTYNSYGELATHTVTSGGTTLYALVTDETAAPRGALGRITRKAETVEGATTVEEYGYDVQGRLTDVVTDGIVTEHYD